MGESTSLATHRKSFSLSPVTQGFECLYARSQAPPACPSDLNLAQYTKLLFDKRCVVSPSQFFHSCSHCNNIIRFFKECNSPHGSHVSWVHRLRVCSKCLQGNRYAQSVVNLDKLDNSITQYRFTILTSPYRYWRVIQMMRTFVNGSE